jgi:hypothetical protein
MPENKRDDLLGRHFAGTQRVIARPQPVKVEADGIAASAVSKSCSSNVRPVARVK